MATIIAAAATSSIIGTRLTGLQTNSARFGFGTKRATKKAAGPGSDRRMLCPGVKALEWLDGSLVGHYGFDPCGLGKPAEYLHQLEVLGSLDQDVAMNLVGEVVGTTIDVTDVKWTILAALGALAAGWLAGAGSQSKSKPLRPQFVLFGSSIVQFSYYEGWGSLLAHFYARQADIFLRGYSGWNSRRAVQVLDKVFPRNAASQPSLVIVYFGGNDSTISNPNGIGPHVPLEEYVENMRKIATHVQSLSEKTRLLVLSNPPVNEAQIVDNSDAWGRPLKTNEACRIYSEACLELCREMNITAIDLWTLIQKREDWREVSFVDGVHLTYEASKTVAKEILKVIKEANWEPSLHYQSMPIEFSEDSPYDPVGADGNSTVNISGIFFPDPNEWK